MEFKMLVLQLEKLPIRWVTRHNLRGLNKYVHSGLVPFLEGEKSLDVLVKKACNIARNVEFGKSLEQAPQ